MHLKESRQRRGVDRRQNRTIGLLSLIGLTWYRYNLGVHVGLRQFVELLIFLPASGNAEATIRGDDVWAVCIGAGAGPGMAGPISKNCTPTTSCLSQTSGLITIAD